MMGVPSLDDNMDRIECSGVYIDHRVTSERWVYQNPSDGAARSTTGSFLLSDEPESLRSDVELLLDVCKQIYLCHAGPSLATTLAEISERSLTTVMPVFAFFDIDLNAEEGGPTSRKNSRGSWPEMSPPSPSSLRRGFTFSSQSEGTYDLKLLSGLSADIQVQESPNLIIPVAILRSPSGPPVVPTSVPPTDQRQLRCSAIPEPQHISKCLDSGAVDVIPSPLDCARVQGLIVHAYRARKSALKEHSRFLSRRKLRKHSWVGVNDEQPYAYLREAMVSKLMKNICNPEEFIEEFQDRELEVSPERAEYVKEEIGKWSFTAQEFSDDELVLGACEMIQHAFTLPNTETWHITPGELRIFLLACRASYNNFVLYHNFRHAIDVLQSLFSFLLHIGALPPYRSAQVVEPKCPISSLLHPFDTLTLLISAIGHDVGHPGVNNFFLVKLNAPLAQLYNDNSVLEAFHCAAFSQILRRYWPSAFKDRQLRKLLISSILATDMGVHQKFMERLGSLQERFYENGKSVEGWKPQDVDMYKTLLCGLLIKCADISNVARPWEVAEKWTKILQEEFANQGEMEKEVGMETALFGGPPELGNVYKLATGQIGFMSIFALPLFEGISDVLPDMRFTVEHIRSNQSRWHYLADLERRKQALYEPRSDEHVSPRSESPAISLKGLKPPLTDLGPDSPAKPIFPPTSVGSRRENAGDYFASEHASTESSPSSDINENTISPVVSPDTPGPSMDITGSSFPSEPPSRKSSSAVPDLAMISIAGASPRNASVSEEPSQNEADGQSADVSHISRDPTALAAVLYGDGSANGGEDVQIRSSALDDTPAERPSSSRHANQGYRRQHANTGSSGRTSGPSNSQRNSCTRTQSTSAYSNPMTPISPATNATSLLSVDGGDDKGVVQGRNDHDDSDMSSANPASCNQYAASDAGGSNIQSGESHTSHSQADEKSNTLSPGLGMGHGSSGESAAPSGSGRSDNHSHSHHGHNHNHNGGDSPTGESTSRRLLKRRSRLRLAFWKRKTHHSPQQELSGES